MLLACPTHVYVMLQGHQHARQLWQDTVNAGAKVTVPLLSHAQMRNGEHRTASPSDLGGPVGIANMSMDLALALLPNNCVAQEPSI